MKNLIFSLATITACVLISTQSLAASQRLPEDAQMVTNLTATAQGDESPLNALQTQMMSFASHANFELECKTVYRVWSLQSSTKYGNVIGGTFGTLGNVLTLGALNGLWDSVERSKSATASVTLYCEPRNYADQTIVAAQQSCKKGGLQDQENPGICMSENYLAQFRTIVPTKYVNLKASADTISGN
jgi:hypothetical protein